MDFKRLIASAPRKHERGQSHMLLTPWGENLDSTAVRAEHPRPQFARDNFTMLNGWWSYAFHPLGQGRPLYPPSEFDGRILVPFSPESALSCVGRQLGPDEVLWYARRVPIPAMRPGDRCLLHFEAVDYGCSCYVNGRAVGTHEGGYLPFSFDITEAIQLAVSQGERVTGRVPSEVTIALCVWDPSDASTQPRGKQKLKPGGIWYTAQSGIWQPVWMEVVPERHIGALVLRPNAQTGVLWMDVDVCATEGQLQVFVTDGLGQTVATGEALMEHGAEPVPVSPTDPVRRRVRLAIPVPGVQLWEPENPVLYDVTLRFSTDVVHSYTAFRTVEVKPDDEGVFRFHLNGRPYLLRGVLDQGYWSDGLMTAPADEALVFDIQAMKEAGFNMLRKHLKVEADRWYYHCDRLGMLVWQDMVNGGGPMSAWQTSYRPTLFRRSWGKYSDVDETHVRKLGAGDQLYRQQWHRTCGDVLQHLGNHPSVVTWVLFNEAWGQFDAASATEAVRRLDPTRPVDSVSGWYDQHCGDFLSVHNYFRKLKVYKDKRSLLQGYAADQGGRAFVISEFGGVAFAVPDHTAFEHSYGYGACGSAREWRSRMHDTVDKAAALEESGLSGFVYTQLSDVEEEINGILTYDRRANKLKGIFHGDQGVR